MTLHRQTAIIDPRGGVTSFTFDAVGNRTSLTDPVGNTTTWLFDGLNRAIEETNALGFTRFFSFDAVGNNTRIIDRNGRIREFDYDALYRMTAERWLVPDPSLPAGYSVLRTISSIYDAASQLAGVSDPDYTGTFTYDLLGRVLSIGNLGTPNLPHTILTHTWDPSGNRTSLTASIDGFGSIVNNYQYDVLNRTTRIEQTGTGVTQKRVDLSYNGLGQFTRIDRYRDLGGTQLLASSTYEYDSLARLTSLVHTRPSALDPQPSTIAAYSWSYDALSRITAMTTPDGAGNYSYDPTSQLIAEDYDSFQPDQTHTWDLNGNPVGPGFLVGPNNQLLETPTHEYQYDPEGNRIREVEKATGNVRHFEWDHRSRLVEVRDELVGPGGTGGTAVSAVSAYRYHPLTNYRISKDVRAFDSATGDLVDRIFEAYTLDGPEILAVNNEALVVTEVNLHASDIDHHLASEKFGVDALVAWLLPDHQNSARDIVTLDQAGADLIILQHVLYDAFGRPLFRAPSGDPADPLSRYAYTGREWDPETGLMYYRARYYDPVAKRFVTEDPIGFATRDANMYRYVNGVPVLLSDPFGTDPIEFEFNAFIPGRLGVWLPEPAGVPGFFSPWWYKGDDRGPGGGSSRVFGRGSVESTNIGYEGPAKGFVSYGGSGSTRRRYHAGVGWQYQQAKAPTDYYTKVVSTADPPICVTIVHVFASAQYPFVGGYAPNIDFSVDFEFRVQQKDVVDVVVAGWHNLFPDYEALVDGQVRYHHPTTGGGPGALNLNAFTYFIKRFQVEAPTHCLVCEGTFREITRHDGKVPGSDLEEWWIHDPPVAI